MILLQSRKIDAANCIAHSDIACSRHHKQISQKDICKFLMSVESDFTPPLHRNVNLAEYAHKLRDHADYFAFASEKQLLAAVFFYVREETSDIYVPIVACLNAIRGHSFGSKLMRILETFASLHGLRRIQLQTASESRALSFYLRLGYQISRITDDRNEFGSGLMLSKSIASKGEK